MTSYFYKGRHRAPSNNARNLATLATSAGIAFGGISTLGATSAHAEPPGGWGPVIQCESGNKNIENLSTESSASGYFQFVDGTWRENGGREFASRAIGASFEEQLIVANRLFAKSGLTPWDASRSCWSGKVGPTTAPTSSKNARQRTNQRLAETRLEAGATHVVRSGDTLSKIAGKHWKTVYEANKGTIGSNPNRIFPGQIIRL